MRKHFLLLPLLLAISFVSGYGQSLGFNGSSNYVNIGNNTTLQLQNFTLEAWINIQGSGGTTGTQQGNENGGFKASTVVPLIAKGHREKGGTTSAINYFFGYQSSDRRLVADFEDNATGAHHTIVGKTSLPTNTWVHIAVTYEISSSSTNKSVWTLYINGSSDQINNLSGNYTPQSGSTVSTAIASSLNSSGSAEGFFNGMVDEVRIWNLVRTGSDIFNNYKLEIAGATTGLVARYGFNEGSGTTAANSAASNSTGKLVNSPQWTLGFNQTAPTNNPPVLNPIGNKTVTVGQTLTFTATASDPDAGQTLTFSLIGAPAGATINSTSGSFSWTPASAGPFTFTVRVSDNGSPIMYDDEQITITVNSTTTNSPPNAPASPSPADVGSSSYSNTSLCVTATDPDNDPLRVRFYGRKKVTKDKFAIVIMPDTQVYTEEPQGTSGAYNRMFKSQTVWIANNRIAKNIVYAGHLGDCVEHGDTFEVEWKRVDTTMRTLEDSSTTGLIQGVPYGVCVGNHDQSLRGDPLGTTTYYNKYFGSSRYTGRTYYGGHNGSNNDNNYQLFSASGIDFLVISPEYDQSSNFTAPGGALDWGESLIKAYPNRRVIVMTHYVLTGSATWSAQGLAIYNRYKIYPNFIMMIGGHISANTGESRRTDTYNGNTVQSVVSDYQSRTNGGNGLMRIYTFDPTNNTVAAQTYSPYTNAFETDASSQFTLNINLATTPDAYTLVGEVSNVTSGTNTCMKWPSLMDNTTYEWYAEAWDGKTTTTGPVWSFKTKSVINVTTSISSSNQLDVIREETSTATNQDFLVYPNPNNTRHLNITLPNHSISDVQVEISDLVGKRQFRKDFKEVTSHIDFEHHLAPGTYVVIVTTNSSYTTRKLVVIE